MSNQAKHGRLSGAQHSRNLSNLRNAQMTIPYRNGISTSLRATQIINWNSSLSAELIALILNYVAIPDLMRCAQVSKRLQEMVYDDTRWVQRLKLMDAWDETKARHHFEDSMRKRRRAESHASGTLFDARQEERRKDGFSEVITHDVKISPLHVLDCVQSVRGRARQEYAKIYTALAPLYNDIGRSTGRSQHVIFQSFHTPEDQAKVLHSLSRFANQDGSQRKSLEALIDVFQRAVVHEYQQGIQAGDVNGRMKRYARVLTILGRGQTAINMYISSIPELQTEHNPTLCLEDVASGHVDLNPCNRFFEQVSSTTQRRASEITLLFTPAQNVLSDFLTKISHVIEDYTTVLFDEAHRTDRETYCKAVAGSFENATNLITEIKSYTAIDSQMLEDLLRNCFVKHMELYLTEELALFTARAETEVSDWEKQHSEQQANTESFFMSNVSRQAAKRDFLSSFKKVVMMPVTVVASPFAAKKPIEESRSSTPRPDAPMTELAAKTAIMNSRLENIRSLFSLQVAINLTQYAKASLERTTLFVRVDSKAKAYCESIFVDLLRTLGTRHIQAGFDKALDHLSDYNPQQVREYRNTKEEVAVEPLVTFLELVNVGDLIQQMIDVFYNQEMIMTKLSERDDFLDPAVIEKKTFEQMLDARVAAGLNKGIDVLMSEVDFTASSQAATDFNPVPIMKDKKWVQPDIDIGPSPTAQQVVDIVSGHTNMLIGSTEKSMLDVFMQEVATRLFGVVCKHVKRQRISVTGSIKLISDLNHYAAFITGLRQKPVLPYAAVLKEIGQIYLVHIDPPGAFGRSAKITQQQSKELATIIADTNRYWGILPVEEVYEFAERRADWHIVKSDVDRAMYGVGCSIM